jgi:hypothetical protein
VDPTPEFMTKAARVVAILQGELPSCCRARVSPLGAGEAPRAQ